MSIVNRLPLRPHEQIYFSGKRIVGCALKVYRYLQHQVMSK